MKAATLRASIALAVAAAGLFAAGRLAFAPIPVVQLVVKSGSIEEEVPGTGTLDARVKATIGPRISGLITRVLGDQGSRVTTGQELALLHDGDLRQQVEIARADVAASRASVERARADINRTRATAKLAKLQVSRVAPLVRSGGSTEHDLDLANERRSVAEAELNRAELVSVELERHVAKAEETLRFHQERLAETRISAPFDGLIVRRSREPGDVVVPGSEIFQMVSTSQMWVSAWVDETSMASVAAGQAARVVFRTQPDRDFEGTVARVAPAVDPETREFLVDVAIARLPAVWAIGQRAEVYIRSARKESALLVPREALSWKQGQAGVFVGSEGRARWRPVELGLRGARDVEVARGLQAGETVVWTRGSRPDVLFDNARIAAAQ